MKKNMLSILCLAAYFVWPPAFGPVAVTMNPLHPAEEINPVEANPAV